MVQILIEVLSTFCSSLLQGFDYYNHFLNSAAVELPFIKTEFNRYRQKKF